jgi:two-component system chemotaxis response regulator CheY
MSKKILIVDDATTVRSLAKFALSKAGFAIVEAEDGAIGLQKAKAEKPDLIISDLNMPNMNGLEMCRAIKSDDALKATPIFMLTTEASADVAKEGKEIGIMAWIVKPFAPDKLLAAVNKVLGA